MRSGHASTSTAPAAGQTRSEPGAVPPQHDFSVMGVVNVTPDSFSDGGLYIDAGAAIAHGLELEAEGAAILDIGGESTRPGAAAGRRGRGARARAAGDRGAARAGRARPDLHRHLQGAVAAAALDAGRHSRQRRHRAARRSGDGRAGGVARRGVLPHAHARRAAHDAGRPALRRRGLRRQGVPGGADGVRGRAPGVAEEQILLDPGIGFGKTAEHNLELLARLDELVALGRPVVIGTSRKSFLGKSPAAPVEDRLAGEHRHQRPGLRARRPGVPRPRCRPGA